MFLSIFISMDRFGGSPIWVFSQFGGSSIWVVIVIVVIIGAFKVDVSNWTPFAPNGYKAVFTGATVVFFAYVGFDAVANSAEESKRPQRDLPLGIIGSLLICIVLYIGVFLVITGMVPYYSLGEEAPLAEAFTSKGLKYDSVLISVGAVARLTTTLLVGLYVQSQLYIGLGRDALLPPIFDYKEMEVLYLLCACLARHLHFPQKPQ